jgi:UPF0755 protein
MLLESQMQRNRKKSTVGGWIGLLLFLLIGLAGLIIWLAIPMLAKNSFGTASSVLTKSQRWSYSAQLLIHQKKLLTPNCTSANQIDFLIAEGESINTIADHLETQGIINNAKAFRAYLIYAGLDTQIRAGEYQLVCDVSSIRIAQEIKNNYLTEVVFNILPGWRAEEIAAALPTSGIGVTPEEFMAVVQNPNGIQIPAYIPQGTTLEGFLFPGEYLIKRTISAQQLVQLFVDRFDSQISPEITQKITDQGLTFYQGIILASIVQRETYANEERSMIASVFYNRLATGMRLETDPTVQYALGFDSVYGWWKSPLSVSDLEVQSAYNTYMIAGLPPAPIANPDLSSIQAVANPESSTFLYFRARCDGNGYHVFAQTFEEHVANACK